MIAPTKTGTAAHDVDYSFEFSMMMRAGLGVWVNYDCSSPELLGADAGVGDGFGARHAGRLGRVAIEFAIANDAQAVILPVGSVVHDLPRMVQFAVAVEDRQVEDRQMEDRQMKFYAVRKSSSGGWGCGLKGAFPQQ